MRGSPVMYSTMLIFQLDDNTPEKCVDIKIKALTGYSIVFLFVQKIDDPLKFNFVGQLG